jgi:Domain of unknown function (DUF4157)
VFFGAGEYRPGTAEGQEVLAHELTHTLQQSGSTRRTVAPGGMISRLVYNQAPTTWPAANTMNRRRSGEGAEGVFFVNDAGAVFAPGTVVVKPVRSHADIDYASKFLREGMGFDTPDSVSYTKVGADGQALATVVTTPGLVTTKAPGEARPRSTGRRRSW